MNIKIALKITNTIGNIHRKTSNTNKYDHTSIYKPACLDCQKSYIGQTGRSLRTAFNEHTQNTGYNRDDSGCYAYRETYTNMAK
jgi:hypothetical protein